jgi:hypothetical protein
MQEMLPQVLDDNRMVGRIPCAGRQILLLARLAPATARASDEGKLGP